MLGPLPRRHRRRVVAAAILISTLLGVWLSYSFDLPFPLDGLAVGAQAGAVVAALSLTVTTVVALPWLHSSGAPARLDAGALRVAGGLVLSSALYGALGVSVGALVRNQTAAVALVLAWLLAVEGIVADVFTRSTFVDWLPVAAGRELVNGGSSQGGLSLAAATAAFAGYVAVLTVAAARLTLQRDIT